MAIFWCDPYIESPSGGVDGTTGIGTLGSYANPYSIGILPMHMYATGDEIRLKALPANPWLTDPLLAWHPSFSIGGSHGVRFTSAPDQHSFIKYTSIKGEKTYLSWNTPNRSHTSSSPPVWGGMSPYADVTLPAYKLDPQYYLSNLVTPNQSNMLRTVFGAETTLTAGWVSETARGGETIIHRVNPTAVTEWWFGNHYNDRMTVDAPELTISRSMTANSMHIKIFGKTVEVHDIIERSGTGSSCSVEIRTNETFKANSVASSGYIRLYTPYYNTTATQGINRDIKHITAAYQIYTYSQGANVVINLKFKNLLCYFTNFNAAVTFNYYDDFFFYVRDLSNMYPTEMAIDPAVNIATVFSFKGPIKNIIPKFTYNTNDSGYRNYNGSPLKTTGGYLTNGGSIDIAKGDVYFRDFLLPTGDTLENTTSTGVISGTYGTTQSHVVFIGKAWGVDRNSGRRLVFSRTGGNNGVVSQLMMMYNSTEFNNKLVYHIMPNPWSIISYDIVYLDMPTGLSEITSGLTFRLKFTLGGAVSDNVVVKAWVSGNSNPSNSWGVGGGVSFTITPSAGGEGTVIYSPNFLSHSGNIGAQQLELQLGLRQPSYGVAKICIDSIELEVV